MAEFNLGQKIRVSSKHANIDERYGVYNSITEALANNSLASRDKGRTVGILENGKVVEYWFESGTADSDLVKKTQGGSGELKPVFITATMTDIQALESETQEAIDQKLATWIGSQDFVIPEGEIWFFELLREGSDEGSNLTLEQARQNGNVLEGDVEFSDNGEELLTSIFKFGIAGKGEFVLDDIGGVFMSSTSDSGLSILGASPYGLYLTDLKPGSLGLMANKEFNKQGDRKAFAQLSDVEDQFKNLPNVSGIPSYNKMLVTDSAGVVGVRDNLQIDKSSDATFNAFKVRNERGDEAYVDNAYNALKQSFTKMTTTQALELAQLLNGGAGSAGNMSVNLISPPIVQSQYDSVEYVLLRGANLNLNTTAMSIQILASDKTTVIATIPNNQIQLNSYGLSLVFYYNFHNFSVGTYFIKLVSGAKTYITTLDLKIVESVENINTSSITWNIVYSEDITPNSSDIAQGAIFTTTTPAGLIRTPIVSLKSSELFAQGEDFYIEYQINTPATWTISDDAFAYFGLGYSNTDNLLIPLSLENYSYRCYEYSIFQYINGKFIKEKTVPSTTLVTIIKTGNLFRVIVDGYTEAITLSNNSGYSLFFQFPGRPVEITTQGQIIKAFKFN